MEFVQLFAFEYFLNPAKRIFWGYLLSALLISIVYFLFSHKNELKRNCSKAYWLHPSAIIDYKYFIIGYFIKVYLVMPVVISAKTITLFIYQSLTAIFEPISVQLSYPLIILSYTFCLFVVSDLSRYWLHRMMHRNKFLWEFHKVHHSAKVLNPLTFYRVHPVENLLFGFRYALVIGVVTGVFLYLFGARIQLYEIVGVNIFIFIFSLLGGNLRHSNVRLGYWSWLEHIFISPKQHQIHHSTQFFNKNYGGYLAIWDLAFGSLRTSKDIKRMTFGLHRTQMPLYRSIKDILLQPFIILFTKYLSKKQLIQPKTHGAQHEKTIFINK